MDNQLTIRSHLKQDGCAAGIAEAPTIHFGRSMLGFFFLNQNTTVQAALNNAMLAMGVDGKLDSLNEEYFQECQTEEAEEGAEIGVPHMTGLFLIVAAIAASALVAMIVK